MLGCCLVPYLEADWCYRLAGLVRGVFRGRLMDFRLYGRVLR